MIDIGGEIQSVLQRLACDSTQFAAQALAPMVGGHWGSFSFEGHWGPLRVDGAKLVLELTRKKDFERERDPKPLGELRNHPAVLELADGRRIHARLGAAVAWGPRADLPAGATVEFDDWTTASSQRPPARWIGELRGAGFREGNIWIEGARRSSALNMRIAGHYTWYLIDRDRKKNDVPGLVIDMGGRGLDREALGRDFMAIEFAFGTELGVDTLVGLDGPGNVIELAGVGLGRSRALRQRRSADGPVPDGTTRECWIPMLARQLALAQNERDDLPWAVAFTAYVDSANESTIDGAYLKLQVAIEAFAKALVDGSEKRGPGSATDKPEGIVRNKSAWLAWVRERRDELRGLALAEHADVFVNKVVSAMNLPSSGVVSRALGKLDPPLLVDSTVLGELARRNTPAHHFTMNKPGDVYEIDRDVRRINVLRTLLAALVARACKYEGAISGWETSGTPGNWKPTPPWWPSPSPAVLADARAHYLCGESRARDGGASLMPKGVFRSRISRRTRHRH